MNRLWGDGKDGKVMVCILEPGNIQRMVEERKPIQLDLNDGPYERGLPAKLQLVIAYSETPVADWRELHKLLPDALKSDQRTPVLKTKVPHCPECKSTIEELGVWRNDSPVWLTFCVMCGCVLGSMPPAEALRRGA